MASEVALLISLPIFIILGALVGQKIIKHQAGFIIGALIGFALAWFLVAAFITSWMSGNLSPFGGKYGACDPTHEGQLSWSGCANDKPYCSVKEKLCKTYEECVAGGEPSTGGTTPSICFMGV